MVGYVQKIASDIEKYAQEASGNYRHNLDSVAQYVGILPVLVTELDRLDPRDFKPNVQVTFATVIHDIKTYADNLTISNFSQKFAGWNENLMPPTHEAKMVKKLVVV